MDKYSPLSLKQVSGPYDFQRLRHRLGEYPRPAQPNINQPSKKPVKVFGQSSQEYWNGVSRDYRKRK